MNPIQGDDEWGGFELIPEGVVPLNPPQYFERIEQDARLRLYNYASQVMLTQNVNPMQLRDIVGYKVYNEGQTTARLQELFLNHGFYDYIVGIINNEMQAEGVVPHLDVGPAVALPPQVPIEIVHDANGPNTPPPPVVD